MSKDQSSGRRRFLRAGVGVVVATSAAGCAFLRDETGQRTDGAELRQIEYGQTKSGFVHEDDGTDPEYGDVAEPVAFEGEAGDDVTITVHAPNTSAYLVLTDAAGTLVAEHDHGDGPESVIEVVLPETGSYTIWVGSTSGAETGPYELTLERA